VPKRTASTRREDTAKASAIVAELRAGFETSEQVFAAFAELDALPPDVARAALEKAMGIRQAPDAEPAPMILVPVRTTHDADVLDLGDTAQGQLRIAGRSWDGLDLEPEERLDGEREDTFAGTLVARTFADEAGTPLFDVLTYADDSGAIFRAGTTDLVGAIAYGTVEMKDRRTRAALQEALAAPSRKRAAPKKKATSPKKKAGAKTKAGAKRVTTKKRTKA
jgi:hypothetical protein